MILGFHGGTWSIAYWLWEDTLRLIWAHFSMSVIRVRWNQLSSLGNGPLLARVLKLLIESLFKGDLWLSWLLPLIKGIGFRLRLYISRVLEVLSRDEPFHPGCLFILSLVSSSLSLLLLGPLGQRLLIVVSHSVSPLVTLWSCPAQPALPYVGARHRGRIKGKLLLRIRSPLSDLLCIVGSGIRALENVFIIKWRLLRGVDVGHFSSLRSPHQVHHDCPVNVSFSTFIWVRKEHLFTKSIALLVFGSKRCATAICWVLSIKLGLHTKPAIIDVNDPISQLEGQVYWFKVS
jgi:hypothetical protein